MKKIVLIIPYFGSFNSDFPFWVKSVADNETVDFLLITDNEVCNPPKNLRVQNFSFNEVRNMIQKLFDFKICLDQPYKLCDFRPCFGEAFAEYIKEYDFWGYTDMDMVYGNIRNFITEDLLSSYDRILGLGHFSLFRNVKNVNEIYRKVSQPAFQQVFTYPCGCAFDEYWGVSRYMDLNMKGRFFQSYPFDDIDCMKYAFQSQMRRREDTGKTNFIYSYEQGKLYRIYEFQGKLCKDETMYVHFQKRNMKIQTKATDFFMMIPNAYISYIPNLCLEQLRLFNVTRTLYLHAYKLQWKRVKNKWKKVIASLTPGEFGIPKLPKDAIKYYTED